MTEDSVWVLKIRQEIVATARSMLSGEITYIEGARRIASRRFSAMIESDVDILPFVGIDSEKDALPLGDARVLWNIEALSAVQSEIDNSERWAHDIGRPHCENLIRRFS